MSVFNLKKTHFRSFYLKRIVDWDFFGIKATVICFLPFVSSKKQYLVNSIGRLFLTCAVTEERQAVVKSGATLLLLHNAAVKCRNTVREEKGSAHSYPSPISMS